mgnify:CR=1 FL=1
MVENREMKERHSPIIYTHLSLIIPFIRCNNHILIQCVDIINNTDNNTNNTYGQNTASRSRSKNGGGEGGGGVYEIGLEN